MNIKYIVLVLSFFAGNPSFCKECGISQERKIDCYPESTPLSQDECLRKGCCYNPVKGNLTKDNVPWCYYPSDYPSYILTNFEETEFGYSGILKLANTLSNHPTDALAMLSLNIYMETPQRLHFKITDPTKTRYEVPIKTPNITVKSKHPLEYSVEAVQSPNYFSLNVKRKSSNIILFDSSIGPLLFGDQFLQISTRLPSTNLYGLGERHSHLRPDVYWNRIPFWAADHAPGFPAGGNLYGDHPFYLNIEPDGNSHGVFFLNSNAKEAELQPEPALTWRSIGGIMDFYVFMGPTPDKVIQQYTEVVGRPIMPPLWSLGFHLCRWGYKTSNKTLEYVRKMRDAGMPQDVQWNDIDYMDKKLDFTYNKVDFDTLPQLVDDLHAHGQHYVMIIDPGISSTQPKGSYPPYDMALNSGLFVNDTNGNPVTGVVWPGKVSFPDFTNPMIEQYWFQQLATYHSKVPFDGVWIDMNELSNFKDGSPELCHKDNPLDYPPYVPRVTGGHLFSRTICPSALQYNTSNYNVHSLTGLFEMKATRHALMAIRNRRPFVISRSTYPSAGLYGGHWTGDIKSTWEHMRLTIPGILGFNLFGIPLVGADICGFGGSTTEELCIRWSQLGAFYPFSRNHNNLDSSPQAPVDFSSSTQKIIKDALMLRYTLLPYLYTLFHYAHVNGTTVARPLFFEFMPDETTYGIESQFMWGSALLITPVLEQNATSVEGYFPPNLWYDIYMKKGHKIVSRGEKITLSAPLDYIPLHIRGGHIIPGAISQAVTNIKNPFFILVAPDERGRANGSLFWDDGESLDTYERAIFVLLRFTMQNNSLVITLSEGSVHILQTMFLDRIILLGIDQPNNIKINGKSVSFETDQNGQTVIHSKMNFSSPITVTWDIKQDRKIHLH